MPMSLPQPSSRVFRRVIVGAVAVGAGLLVTAGPASAHVEIQEGDQAAGSEAVLTFGVPHGCEDSPTTKIRIQLPESIPTVTPVLNANWDISLVKQQLDAPIDLGEGESITERITEVDFAAKTPLPIGFMDTLKLSVKIPDDAAGTTLTFPTIQECTVGQTDWTQLPAAGQDPEELAHPAPAVNVVAAAEGEGGHHDEGDAESSTTIKDTTTTTAPSSDDSGDDGSSRGLAIAGLATGVVGMALGGRALAVSRGGSGASGSSDPK